MAYHDKRPGLTLKLDFQVESSYVMKKSPCATIQMSSNVFKFNMVTFDDMS